MAQRDHDEKPTTNSASTSQVVQVGQLANNVDEQIQLMLAGTRRARILVKILVEVRRWKLEWKQLIVPWLNQMESVELQEQLQEVREDIQVINDRHDQHDQRDGCDLLSSSGVRRFVHQISLPRIVVRFHFSIDHEGSVTAADKLDEWIIDGLPLDKLDKIDKLANNDSNQPTFIQLRETLGFSALPFNLWIGIFYLIADEFANSNSSYNCESNSNSNSTCAILNQQYDLGLAMGKLGKYQNTKPQFHLPRKYYNPRIISTDLTLVESKSTSSNYKFVWLNWTEGEMNTQPAAKWFCGNLPDKYSIYRKDFISDGLIVAQMTRVIELLFDKNSSNQVVVDKYVAATNFIRTFKVEIQYGEFFRILPIDYDSGWKSLINYYSNSPILFYHFPSKELDGFVKVLGEQDATHFLNWFGHCTKSNLHVASNRKRGLCCPDVDDDFTDLVYPQGAFSKTAVTRSLRYRDSVGKLLHEHALELNTNSLKMPRDVTNIVFGYLPLLLQTDIGLYVDVYPRTK